jgi:nucleotide-binding universal stress UspA family protein
MQPGIQVGMQAGKENIMEFKKILNPVDGSGHSINSTRYAIELARLMDAEVILLHCHARFPIILAEPYYQEAINSINKSSEILVQPFIEMLEQGKIRFDVRILEGMPGNQIPEVARIEKMDLIVMGSRGVTDFAGLFLGSVAHQVLHKSTCPVFITK